MAQEPVANPAARRPAEPRCSFCGRVRWEAGSLVESPAHPDLPRAYICLGCAGVRRRELR